MEEELDIPVKSREMQFEYDICMECGKRKAKYLCDYKVNNKDYCSDCIKKIKNEVEGWKKI